MGLPLNALQAGIYTRLRNHAALAALIGSNKIFDHVPQNTSAPYVLIGDDTLVEAGTKTGNGWELTITIHCWDFEKAGRKSVKSIMSAIYDALHNYEISLTGQSFNMCYLQQEFAETFQETATEGAGDHYYHGVQRFRALITDSTI